MHVLLLSQQESRPACENTSASVSIGSKINWRPADTPTVCWAWPSDEQMTTINSPDDCCSTHSCRRAGVTSPCWTPSGVSRIFSVLNAAYVFRLHFGTTFMMDDCSIHRLSDSREVGMHPSVTAREWRFRANSGPSSATSEANADVAHCPQDLWATVTGG
jgi:hypothetical protein